jgi:hypothetical protein
VSVRLHEVAHCRAGEDGSAVTLSVIPYVDTDYALLVRELTAQRVRWRLARFVGGDVLRFDLPLLPALQFVCTGILTGLGDGVTASLAPGGTRGTSLGSRLLAMELSV